MKLETITKGNEIIQEVKTLSHYKRGLVTDRNKIYLQVEGRRPNKDPEDKNLNPWESESYSHQYNNCPESAKKEVAAILNKAADDMLAVINKRISTLENKFKRLKD